MTLNHPNKAWFRLLMTNKWGETERGVLQNVVGTSRLEVSFENPLDEVRAVYVLVDDPGWKSTEESPFALTITRNWGPEKVSPNALAREDGVWAIVEPIVKKNDAVASEAGALPEG